MSAETYRSGRTYVLDGESVLSVTTILGKGLAKPAIARWAARTCGAYAESHWDWLSQLEPAEVRSLIADAPWRDLQAAAVRGTQVHSLARALAHDEEVEVPETLAGHVESCLRFLNEWQPRDEVTEAPVFSRQHRYAGTFDMLCTLPELGRTLVDYKTNRSGPFGEVGLQLAGYGYADFMKASAREPEVPMPKIDSYVSVWLRADGYDVYPFAVTPATFRIFLYVQQVVRWQEAIERGIKGPAIPPPSAASEVPA